MTEAFIGLGSNVGDRLAYLRAAVSALRELGPVRVSRVYETEPVGPPQARFLNAVAALETELRPRELFDELKRIESQLGRITRERWGPREIDLDLLLHGEESVDEPDLVVPHPAMTVRAFVLVPLGDVLPGATLPGGQMLGDVLRTLETAGVCAFADADVFANQDEVHRKR